MIEEIIKHIKLTSKDVIILVGNIGAGKTTIAKELCKFGCVAASADGIRYAIGAGDYRFDRNLESSVWEVEYFMFKELISKGHTVVVDDASNVSSYFREKYLNILLDHPIYKKIAVVMPKLNWVEAVNRRLSNDHGNNSFEVWKDVWEKFNDVYVEPTKEEGFDKIIKL